MTKNEMRDARLFPHVRTRVMYMAQARSAREVHAQRMAGNDDTGFRFYRPVAYYVMQARRANRQHVQNKVWSNMR